MGLFSPHKRHANKFNYTPRYYDPVKEERERRRAELRGERLDDKGEYTPGKYIRSQREARELRRSQQEQNSGSRMKSWAKIAAVLLLIVFVWYLVPRIASVVDVATTQKKTTTQQEREIKEFDPYAPIIIVPNDYKEGDEIVIIEE
ncbi:MAG: hypothetical protein IJB87_06545 [Alistipes sp.]|nr:hypothetical protein [Rikenellaceae bacterium]MBQ3149005.1 hypothetical protein [Alistipes sp.]MBQ4126962.1 hypothetical protein [Alistipes sp.]